MQLMDFERSFMSDHIFAYSLKQGTVQNDKN